MALPPAVKTCDDDKPARVHRCWTEQAGDDSLWRLAQRSFSLPEVWAEVVNWLNANGIEMPEGVDMERPVEGSAQRHQ